MQPRGQDAEGIVAALEAAGFAAAPAPKNYVLGAQSDADEVIAVSENLHPKIRHAAAAAIAEVKPGVGISPRTLGISLAALLVLLIGVVFFLPEPSPTERDDADTTSPSASIDSAEEDAGNKGVDFSENIEDLSGRDARVIERSDTDEVLGQLLSKMETLESRAVQRWERVALQAGASGLCGGRQVIPGAVTTLLPPRSTAKPSRCSIRWLDEVEQVFATTFSEAQTALDNADSIEAVRLFELAVAISPNHSGARAGYTRAKNLDTVMSLTDQGFEFENDLELEAARQSFTRAVQLDPEWQPAQSGLERVLATIRQMEFDQRMTEGLTSLSERDYPGARAAFRMAQEIVPEIARTG